MACKNIGRQKTERAAAARVERYSADAAAISAPSRAISARS